MVRRVLYETILVVLVAIVVALGAYFLRPQALSRDNQTEKQTADAAPQQLFTPITIKTAKSLFEEGQAVFADARPARVFEEGHIRGALHLEPDEFDRWGSHLMENLQPDQVIVTYCDGLQCPLARRLAEKIASLGFEKVFFLEDGWSQWQAQHMPVAKGK